MSNSNITDDGDDDFVVLFGDEAASEETVVEWPVYLTWIQKVFALLSIICSYAICREVLSDLRRSRRGSGRRNSSIGNTQKSISRILLNLSISDIIFSLSVFLGEWPAPKDTPYIHHAKGNQGFCTFQGWMRALGYMTSPMFSVALNAFYLLMIRYRWQDDKLRRLEYWVTIGIWTYGIILSIIPIPLEAYNSDWDVCWIVPAPLDCHDDECTRGLMANDIEIYYSFVHIWTCVLICLVLMVALFYTVKQMEDRAKMYTNHSAIVIRAVAAKRSNNMSNNNNGVDSCKRSTVATTEMATAPHQQTEASSSSSTSVSAASSYKADASMGKEVKDDDDDDDDDDDVDDDDDDDDTEANKNNGKNSKQQVVSFSRKIDIHDMTGTMDEMKENSSTSDVDSSQLLSSIDEYNYQNANDDNDKTALEENDAARGKASQVSFHTTATTSSGSVAKINNSCCDDNPDDNLGATATATNTNTTDIDRLSEKIRRRQRHRQKSSSSVLRTSIVSLASSLVPKLASKSHRKSRAVAYQGILYTIAFLTTHLLDLVSSIAWRISGMWKLPLDIVAYMIFQPALGLLNFLIFCRNRKTMSTPEGRLLRAIFCFPFTAACCCCGSIGKDGDGGGDGDGDGDGDDDGDKDKNQSSAASATSSVARSASNV